MEVKTNELEKKGKGFKEREELRISVGGLNTANKTD
jgi:hypothetical protein